MSVSCSRTGNTFSLITWEKLKQVIQTLHCFDTRCVSMKLFGLTGCVHEAAQVKEKLPEPKPGCREENSFSLWTQHAEQSVDKDASRKENITSVVVNLLLSGLNSHIIDDPNKQRPADPLPQLLCSKITDNCKMFLWILFPSPWRLWGGPRGSDLTDCSGLWGTQQVRDTVGVRVCHLQIQKTHQHPSGALSLFTW